MNGGTEMNVMEKLVELLGWFPCESDCEGMVGSCPNRKHGYCNEIFKLSYCSVSKLAQHLIAHGVTVQEWISVKDRLPEEKVNCIVHYKHAYCDNDGYWATGICFYDGEKFQLNSAYKVTHWMPLPPAPEVKND